MKLKYFSFVIAGMAIASSCKKGTLDLYPEGSVTTNNFYKSTTDFQQAITGAYVPLRNIAEYAFFIDEMRSDNTHYEYNSKDRGGLGYEQLADFMDDSQNGITGQRWQYCYQGIARCNTVLSRLPGITFTMSDADKNQITGEAKALRAHYYFDLVRHFGAVPLVVEEITDPNKIARPRTGVDSIYNQIITDFTEAIPLLGAPTVKSSVKINKASASAELALAYMVRKQWDKAVPLLQFVYTAGYDLVPSYRNIFDPANKANVESIWEVQYKAGNEGHQSYFIYRFIPVMPSTKVMLGIEYNNVNGGWNIPTEDLVSKYDPADARLNYSVGIVEGKMNGNVEFVVDSVIQRDIRTYTTPAGSVSQRFVKKYYYPPYTLPGYNTGQNWPLFRFGGVCLLLAEALNENNQSGDALAPLNRVRARAGLTTPITETNKDLLREIIFKEQRLELAFENYRWMDLVRTNRAATVMTAHGLDMKARYPYLNANSYNVTPKKYIYPVPFREMQLNPTWNQNDY